MISWRPPPGNEGEELGYVVRFFDGDTYDSSASGYRSLQRYYQDIGRHWARAKNLPTDGRTIYADVGKQHNGRVSHLLQIYTRVSIFTTFTVSHIALYLLNQHHFSCIFQLTKSSNANIICVPHYVNLLLTLFLYEIRFGLETQQVIIVHFH